MGGVQNSIDLVACAVAATKADVVIEVAAAAELELVDGKAPTRFKIIPVGKIEMRDGRGPYRVRDKAHAEEIVAATARWFGAADMPGDYDHQMMHAAPGSPTAGGRAPASGWVKTANLTAEDDGIYANDVSWTPAAAKAIEDKEYRYVSPLFRALKPAAGGDVLTLKNFALVGIGAIDLPELIAAGLSGEEDPMSLAAIAALVGLSADASADQVSAKVAELKTAASPAVIAAAAGLAETATVEEVAAAVATLKSTNAPDLSAYVPKDVVEPMKAQLAALTKERLGKRVDELVAAGVVVPAKRDATLKWFETDEVAASAFFADHPVVVAPGSVLDGKKPAEKATTLTVDEIAACAAIGMSHEEYLAAKNEEVA